MDTPTAGLPDLLTLMHRDITRLKERVARWFQDKPTTIGYPTSLARLDSLSGGLIPGEVTVVAGGPGSGKTSFAMQAVESAATWSRDHGEKKYAIVFSCEMSRMSLYLRSASRLAGLDSVKVRLGSISETELDRFNNCLEILRALPIVVIDMPGVTSVDIRALVQSLVEQGETLSVVAVDYIQLLSDQGENANMRVSRIMDNLRIAAQVADCCVLSLSQFSREGLKTNRRPQLSDLRDSGSIEQTAHQVWALYDPDPHNTAQVRDRELLILKNRSGRTGRVLLDFNSVLTAFHERSK